MAHEFQLFTGKPVNIEQYWPGTFWYDQASCIMVHSSNWGYDFYTPDMYSNGTETNTAPGFFQQGQTPEDEDVTDGALAFCLLPPVESLLKNLNGNDIIIDGEEEDLDLTHHWHKTELVLPNKQLERFECIFATSYRDGVPDWLEYTTDNRYTIVYEHATKRFLIIGHDYARNKPTIEDVTKRVIAWRALPVPGRILQLLNYQPKPSPDGLPF